MICEFDDYLKQVTFVRARAENRRRRRARRGVSGAGRLREGGAENSGEERSLIEQEGQLAAVEWGRLQQAREAAAEAGRETLGGAMPGFLLDNSTDDVVSGDYSRTEAVAVSLSPPRSTPVTTTPDEEDLLLETVDHRGNQADHREDDGENRNNSPPGGGSPSRTRRPPVETPRRSSVRSSFSAAVLPELPLTLLRQKQTQLLEDLDGLGFEYEVIETRGTQVLLRFPTILDSSEIGILTNLIDFFIAQKDMTFSFGQMHLKHVFNKFAGDVAI